MTRDVLVLLREASIISCDHVGKMLVCPYPSPDRVRPLRNRISSAGSYHRKIEYIDVPAAEILAIDSAAGQLTPVFIGEGGLCGLTSDELEGLGLDGLIGVDFRNSTHFGDV